MAAEETKPRHLELPDYIRILSKRKWFILIMAAVAMMMGALWAVSTERTYEATALVHVQQRPEGLFWVTGDTSNMLPNIAMETYARIAHSGDVASRAAERLEALPEEDRIVATAPEILDSVEVSVLQPDLIRITAENTDRRKAKAFANQVAEAFVQVNQEDRQRQSTKAVAFLEDQVQKAEDDIQAVIDEMTAMSMREGYVDVQNEVEAIVEQLRQYQAQRLAAETAVEVAQARVDHLEQVAAEEAPFEVQDRPTPNPEYQALMQSLTEARVQLESLQSKYTDGHARVLDARALVEELQSELERTPELIESEVVAENPAGANVEALLAEARLRLNEAQAQLAASDAALADLRDQARGLPEDLQQWQALVDRLTRLREAYMQLQEELRQARLAETIKEGNARVVDRAQTAREIKANPLRAMVFSLGLGLFMGLGLAILLEALDDTIYSVEDLQRVTDLYLLGIIPLRTDESDGLVTLEAPKSPPAEAYRTLRSNIRFSLFDKPATTFMITSAGTGEGKSVTASNLAVVYAQSGERVILVDADLRRPVLHRAFGVDNEPGVTNLLVGDMKLEDALQESGVPGLRLLTSGPLPPNPAELLESERMTALIEELAEAADIVIFDTPPAVMLTDAGILSSKLDRTIIVAESGQVTERAIHDMERLFRHARADVLGIVLNKLRVTGGDYYYYYYYYYYYHDSANRPDRDGDSDGSNGMRRSPEVSPDIADLNVRDAQDRSTEQSEDERT